MRRLVYITISVFHLIGFSVIGQSTNDDSLVLLSFEDYLSQVVNHHPVFFSSNIIKEQGEVRVTSAKGNFDPMLSGSYKQKALEGKDYYEKLNLELGIPTKLPIEIVAGYSQNTGTFLNPEEYTAEDGLMYMGATIKLGKGFAMDERRFALKQAEIFEQSSEIQRVLQLNELKFDASVAYWDWFEAFNKVKVLELAKENAQDRFNNIKEQCLQGDKPCIDTLKVLIQLQNRTIKLAQAEVEMSNKVQNLELYLWQEGQYLIKLKSNARPSVVDEVVSESFFVNSINVDSVINTHPKLVFQELKIQEYENKTALSSEKRKPDISIGYQALANFNGDIHSDVGANNHLIQAKVSFPIFAREGRGETQFARLKQEEMEYKNKIYNAEIRYKIAASQNVLKGYIYQLPMFIEVVENYNRIFEAEYELFEAGESFMILVNQRDMSRIESQLKLVHFLNELKISEAEFNYQIVNIN